MTSTMPPRMPVLFVGHGSPMNAIEKTQFGDQLFELGRTLPRPQGIVVISAHWQTEGPQAVNVDSPKTIHDFYGFPEQLFKTQYPAPGAPALAQRLTEVSPQIRLTKTWGLDHGAWSVLLHLFPKADVPVLQLSLNQDFTPAEHFSFAQSLKLLRQEGILILASGNIVHNLRLAQWQTGSEGYPWAQSFDHQIKEALRARDFERVIRYQDHFPQEAAFAVPTPEHYWPLLYALAVSDQNDTLTFPVEGFQMASISMTTALWA